MNTKSKTISFFLLILLLELPVFLLILPRGKENIWLCCTVVPAVCLLLTLSGRAADNSFRDMVCRIQYPLCSGLTAFALAGLFFFRWNRSGRLALISRFLKYPSGQSLLILSLILAFAAFPGTDFLFRNLMPLSVREKAGTLKQRIPYAKAYLLLTAFLTMALNSECSPLYPFNTWGDPNCMMTVGKSVLKGLVPYRDLYEQKGPLLLFFHTLGAAVSFDSFMGIWILEIIFCYLFLLLVYRTAGLFFDHPVIILIPLFSALVYSRWAFETGDTAEEFCLPLLAFGLYTGCKALRNNSLPSGRESFLLGITSGCVFWIKYSMTGFYIGWFLVFAFFAVRRKAIRDLLDRAVRITAGILAVTAPILIFFIITGSVSDLYRSYFYNIIFIYAGSGSTLFQNLSAGFEYLRLGNPPAVFCFAAGILWFLLHKKWDQAAFVSTAFLTAYFFIFFSQKRYIYYGLIFSVFAVFGFFWIMELIRFLKSGNSVMATSVFLICGMIFLCCTSRNLPFLENTKADLMQYKIWEAIRETGIRDPSVLEYQTASTGVNTVSALVPKIKYFCSFTAPLEDMYAEQDRCFEEECADFVIIQTRETYDFQEYDQYIHLGGYEGNIHDTKRPYYYHLYVSKRSMNAAQASSED
ncbi:MAG: glycosyltransferase family 39 protein [Anaerolineaceae bacterium]|nr:glycosyltransferase family 39 protein [Anaerolineaceae bacterium]